MGLYLTDTFRYFITETKTIYSIEYSVLGCIYILHLLLIYIYIWIVPQFCDIGKNNLSNGSFLIQCHFQMHFTPPIGHEFQEFFFFFFFFFFVFFFYRMTGPAKQFSRLVLDNYVPPAWGGGDILFLVQIPSASASASAATSA